MYVYLGRQILNTLEFRKQIPLRKQKNIGNKTWCLAINAGISQAENDTSMMYINLSFKKMIYGLVDLWWCWFPRKVVGDRGMTLGSESIMIWGLFA